MALPAVNIQPRRLVEPPLALGAALLWGAIEVLALWRTRGARRAARRAR